MEIEKYTELAVRTESVVDKVAINRDQLIAALRIVVGASEFLDQIKKNVFYGRPFDIGKLDEADDLINDNYWELDISEIDINKEDIADLVNPRVFHALLGSLTESGEIAEALLKSMENNQPIDTVNLSEEIGDLAWYGLGIFPDATGITADSILTTNIKKLMARYPDKFDQVKAQQENRDLDTERNVLEEGTASKPNEI